jgi:sodium/bile acid cotransporter 7
MKKVILILVFLCFLGGVVYFVTNHHAPIAAGKQQRIDEMYNEYRKLFPEVKEMTVGELIERNSRENLVLVDVRTEAERAVSIISGAISIENFKANKERWKNQTIVAYCTIGYRSGLFAKEIGATGFDVYNLKGGVLSWAQTGHELSINGQMTREVHVYGKKWDLLPESYSAVW